MRKMLFLLFTLVIKTSSSYSKERILFKLSKPYCLLNFAEAASGNRNISSTLRKHIKDQIKDKHFYNIIEQYKSIELDYAISQDSLPTARRFPRSTFNLIYIAAAQANDIDDMSNRIMGILPNTAHQQLINTLNQLAPYYDTLLWKKNTTNLQLHLDSLSSYKQELSEMFTTLKLFYNSSWSNDIPFTITLYPIPGNSGHVTATAHNSILSIGVLTKERNYANRVSVIAHEMCHILYREQAVTVQQNIDRYFQSSTSPYKHLAYSYINEALATACGNGWAYKKIKGVLDTGSWYNNEYINKYAKALYPLVNNYITKNQSIDSLFITKAIAIFGQEFPKSIYNYQVLLNEASIYSDAETKKERQFIINSLSKHFNIYSYRISSPISDSSSINHVLSTTQTQLFVINKNHQENITYLKHLFPEIKTLIKKGESSNYYLSFLDKKKRGVIIIHVQDNDMLKKAFSIMNTQKSIDPEHALVTLDVP